MSRRIVSYCPNCDSDRLERCFGVSKELWGWSDHCLDCGWRGHAPHWTDHTVRSQHDDDLPDEREPFIDWPNNMGE